ncbi:hypothetical protein LUZ60_004341 [Juncus effusus]|nr:hypothetical protein LUZ60_004341 [Juncus effusus]
MAGIRFSTVTVALLVLFCHVGPSMAVLFASLNKTLVVTASPKTNDVFYAGESKITLSWNLNETLLTSIQTESYKSVKVLLCYAPVSQKDRKWRKTNPDLKKDKTCQFKIVKKPINSTSLSSPVSFEYLVSREIPSAFYFIRAYALDSNDVQVAFGQTTDKNKTMNVFQIVGISGRTKTIDIAAGVFSAFSIITLVFFFVMEKKKRA